MVRYNSNIRPVRMRRNRKCYCRHWVRCDIHDCRNDRFSLSSAVRCKTFSRTFSVTPKKPESSPIITCPFSWLQMGVAEQLHVMEGQISRLESELQRRDDIIQSLRNTKVGEKQQKWTSNCIIVDVIRYAGRLAHNESLPPYAHNIQ